MNTVYRFRFAWLVLLLSATLFTACKKESVEPAAPADLAERVAGTYRYSELTSNGKTVPADETNLRGTVAISRESSEKVTFTFAITLKNGGAFLDDAIDGISVREANGEVIYEVDGQPFARGKGNNVMINGYDSANVPFTLTATK